MRRLSLEVTEKELLKIGLELPPFKPVKTLELLYFLRQDDKEFAAISQVEFKDSNSAVDQLLEGGYLSEAQVLEHQKKWSYIIFIRSVPSLSAFSCRRRGRTSTHAGHRRRKNKVFLFGQRTAN
jgi:pyruvate formate-lyase activating enzyme-like uncharacterized protein